MTSIVVIDEAYGQLADIDEWWTENRSSSRLSVLDEFEHCVDLLTSAPECESDECSHQVSDGS